MQALLLLLLLLLLLFHRVFPSSTSPPPPPTPPPSPLLTYPHLHHVSLSSLYPSCPSLQEKWHSSKAFRTGLRTAVRKDLFNPPSPPPSSPAAAAASGGSRERSLRSLRSLKALQVDMSYTASGSFPKAEYPYLSRFFDAEGVPMPGADFVDAITSLLLVGREGGGGGAAAVAGGGASGTFLDISTAYASAQRYGWHSDCGRRGKAT
eukprot:CAMPEP_0197549242 /NCGR_PEP_ID=MMETSP1320-20131121/3188_1 /TAXON_ID=91990 /ORGANISM="Bolidomonas sp., Strain RCC2347" /LENGTH=206 /DNA_ID=CAMNT_0043109431 /DNA_START=145 /DNA_END=761 /DNA_ORIENTATION=-